jgi:hypothetical protein
MPAYRISRRLGRRSIKTTIDPYGHLLPEENDSLSEGLDALYRATKKGARAGFSLDSAGSEVVSLPSTGTESAL